VKQLLIRLLNLIGLVPARRHRFLAGQLRDAELRVKKLIKQVHGLEAASSGWKSKANEVAKQLKSRDEDIARLIERSRKQQTGAEKTKQRDAELAAMQARLVEAQRELVAAREHLMAVEVKLDILEGAANVLDVRTRAAIVRQTGETGAPV
jgi:chromosome segregation ATPase